MRRYTVSIDDRSFTIDVVETASDRFEVTVGDRTFEATLHADEDLPGAAISPEMVGPDDARQQAAVPFSAVTRPASDPQATPVPVVPARVPAGTPAVASVARASSDVLAAPMPGVVLQVLVVAGATLRRGDPILVLEAMKMRNTIRAPRAAVVVTIEVEAGQPVGPGDPLVRLAAAPG
ncbi:MAG: biotin/lipoyl-containing protein [Candidatus Limnocylindrales bacterium]